MSKFDFEISKDGPFTTTQKRILGAMLEGHTSNYQLAKKLGLSERAVKWHIVGNGKDGKTPSQRGLMGIAEDYNPKDNNRRPARRHSIIPIFARAGLINIKQRK